MFLWLMLINVKTLLENSGMQALLPKSNSEWWKNLLPPWAAFISRRIRFGLQITTFATVLTRPLTQLPKSKMRTELKQRFEGVWSKTNQEVLQDDSDMDSLFLCLLLVSCFKFLNTSFCKTNSTKKNKIIIFRRQENLGYTASEMFSDLRALSKKGFSWLTLC